MFRPLRALPEVNHQPLTSNLLRSPVARTALTSSLGPLAAPEPRGASEWPAPRLPGCTQGAELPLSWTMWVVAIEWQSWCLLAVVVPVGSCSARRQLL